MSRAGWYWTNKEDCQLKEEYEVKGLSVSEIAVIHGRSRYAIECRIDKMGLVLKTILSNNNTINPITPKTYRDSPIIWFYVISLYSSKYDIGLTNNLSKRFDEVWVRHNPPPISVLEIKRNGTKDDVMAYIEKYGKLNVYYCCDYNDPELDGIIEELGQLDIK